MSDPAIPAFEVAFDGVALTPAHAGLVTELTVTHEVNSLDHFEVTLRNDYPELRFTHGEAPLTRAGARALIRMGYVDDLEVVFDGEVTRIGASFGDAPTIAVAGHSRMHSLRAGTRTETFEQISDGAIAESIAGRHALRPARIGAGVTHTHLMQANQSDFDFLLDRARHLGFVLMLDGQDLHFDAPPQDAPVIALTWAAPADPLARLREFDVTFDATAAADAVVVRGFDLAQNTEIVVTAPPNATANATRTITVADRPVRDAHEASVIATAMLAEQELRSVTGTGACLGNPEVRAGRFVQLDGLGALFSGRYRVTESTHRFDRRGYETTFTVNGEGRGR